MAFLDLTGLQSFKTKIEAWANGKFVVNTRKVNGKALSADITLSATDVQAIPASQKGVANGVASLDGTGKVPSAQLPSYVDDVINGYFSGGKFYKESAHTTEITGEDGKIYVDIATNKTYRWNGTSAFVEISASLALGTTSSTAFRGDYGQTAYTHSQAAHARTDATNVAASTTNGNIKINGTETSVYKHFATTAHASGFYKVATNAEGHVTGVTPVAKADITALGIPGQDTVYTHDTFTAATAGLYKVEVNEEGHVVSATPVVKSDITALGIPAQDTVYTHPAYTAKSSGLYKVTVDSKGHVSATTAVAKADITALGIPAQDTTYTAITEAEIEAMFAVA